MKNLKNLTTLTIIVILIMLSLLGSYLLGKNKSKKSESSVEITSRSILQKITSQYFIVTKTVIVDQKSEIKVDQGSEWSNLFWGQTIKADGLIRIDIGVDLSNLKEEDIIIDSTNKTVKIKLPRAVILDASQFGDIEVTSTKAILKYLLDNNPNEDHNQALKQMTEDAKKSTEDDAKIFDEAKQDSVGMIKLIIENLGYKIEII